MQITRFFLVGLLFYCQSLTAQTQADTARATDNALQFADKFIKANFYQDWKAYEALTCPNAIKYYGGKDAFHEHAINYYYRNEPVVQEKPETVKLMTLVNDVDQWQCVLQKIRNTYIDSRKATIRTYLVGQSMDNGATWKFVDIDHNTMENVIYIMPDLFNGMPIPEKKITFDDEIAMQETNNEVKTTAKKKPTYKRKK